MFRKTLIEINPHQSMYTHNAKTIKRHLDKTDYN